MAVAPKFDNVDVPLFSRLPPFSLVVSRDLFVSLLFPLDSLAHARCVAFIFFRIVAVHSPFQKKFPLSLRIAFSSCPIPSGTMSVPCRRSRFPSSCCESVWTAVSDRTDFAFISSNCCPVIFLGARPRPLPSPLPLFCCSTCYSTQTALVVLLSPLPLPPQFAAGAVWPPPSARMSLGRVSLLDFSFFPKLC